MSVDDFDNIKKRLFLDNKKDDEKLREEFEELIKQRLINAGFDVSARLSTKKILEKITNMERVDRKLVKQITQFINKAQKISYDPNKIREVSKEKKINRNLSKHNEYFIKIACRVYDEYRTRLEKKNHIDFDGLFIDAIDKIKKEETDCKIIYHGEKKIVDIKYILIDEYQDFSELFYRLIDEIRKINPTAYFFCVGDDWQAINGFAGSDLKYFENFETEYFKGGYKTNLLTNYRSNKEIVLFSNNLMAGLGDGGIPEINKEDGSVYPVKLFRVELKNSHEYGNKYVVAASLLKSSINKSIPWDLARYLNTVEYIVSNKVNPKKQICLMFRSNKICGIQISKFADQIRKWRFPGKWDVDKKEDKSTGYINGVICSTAHSFKGKESDIVIIVDTSRRSFPKFHPDNELMEVLGVTIEKVWDEERRLFYVAITRAKEELYLIYDEDVGKSDFI